MGRRGSACYDKQQVGAMGVKTVASISVNSGELTISYGNGTIYPFRHQRTKKIPSPSGIKFALKKLKTLGYFVVLSLLGLNRFRVVTDRQTAGRTEIR